VDATRLILLPDHDRPSGRSGDVGILGTRRRRDDCDRKNARGNRRRRPPGLDS
jgi:hypothetical protein